MRPNLVEIVNKPASLSSERAVNLTCVSEGSRPPAQLTWYKDNRKFRRGKVRIRINSFDSYWCTILYGQKISGIPMFLEESSVGIED